MPQAARNRTPVPSVRYGAVLTPLYTDTAKSVCDDLCPCAGARSRASMIGCWRRYSHEPTAAIASELFCCPLTLPASPVGWTRPDSPASALWQLLRPLGRNNLPIAAERVNASCWQLRPA